MSWPPRWPASTCGPHTGVHPRLGAADVVPFVPLPPSPTARSGVARSGDLPATGPLPPDVLGARDRFAAWAAEPTGPALLPLRARTLTARCPPGGLHVTRARRRAVEAPPDGGEPRRWAPDRCWWPTTCGSPAAADDRTPTPDGPTPCRWPAPWPTELRGPAVRSLGAARRQPGPRSASTSSTPLSVSVADVYDAVAAGAESAGCTVLRAELVGLCTGRGRSIRSPAAAGRTRPQRRPDHRGA